MNHLLLSTPDPEKESQFIEKISYISTNQKRPKVQFKYKDQVWVHPYVLVEDHWFFRSEINGKPMGLISSRAILANVPSGGSIFRLVSALKMKRQGIRYVAGIYNEPDHIECVRTGVTFPTSSTGDVLYVQTSGFAEEITPSNEFKDLVLKISNGWNRHWLT
jgi:hypothetical protein